MPVYCFKCDTCGRTAEEQRRMADSDKAMNCDCGKDMARDIAAEAPRRLAACDTYPHASYAMGGHPDDVPGMVAEDKKLGIRHTNYSADGDPIMVSKQHRKEYAEKRGFFDRNAGHSDPKPKNLT